MSVILIIMGAEFREVVKSAWVICKMQIPKPILVQGLFVSKTRKTNRCGGEMPGKKLVWSEKFQKAGEEVLCWAKLNKKTGSV